MMIATGPSAAWKAVPSFFLLPLLAAVTDHKAAISRVKKPFLEILWHLAKLHEPPQKWIWVD